MAPGSGRREALATGELLPLVQAAWGAGEGLGGLGGGAPGALPPGPCGLGGHRSRTFLVRTPPPEERARRKGEKGWRPAWR